MNTSLQLSVWAELADCDRCTADGLAVALDEPVEHVYAALTALEGSGLARVLVEHVGERRKCYWQAT